VASKKRLGITELEYQPKKVIDVHSSNSHCISSQANFYEHNHSENNASGW